MPIAVAVHNLAKKFGAFTAVNGVSFDVAQGEVFGFLGPNGSGKSTTIRMLCGLLLPTSGTALVAGFDVRREPEKIKANMGYMPQFFSLYQDLTVAENIEFYGGMYSVPPARIAERTAYLAERLELGPLLGRFASTLSTGWRQRLALATTIIHQPPLLFLDEPTSGVDPITRRLFWEVIDDLAHEGATIFVTTHVMDEAEHCTRLAMMHYGDLIAEGPPAELRQNIVRNMVQIQATPLWDALEALERTPEVVDAALFGDALHAECREDLTNPEQVVRAALERAGVKVERVERIVPTMEDVFVSLARRHEPPDRREGGA